MVEEGASDEFEVKSGLRQGSVLSPLLFIAVLDLIRRMANRSYRRQWRSGTICLSNTG